jgi:uncharacterized protein YaaN involved in tellurite resistance
MDENKKDEFIPSLTLDPNGTAAAAAVQDAPAPTLTTDAPAAAAETAAPVEKPDIEKLSPAEQAAVKEFAGKIDVMNTEQVMNYGAAAQKNVAQFSETALNTVRTKDLGEAGTMLSDLVVELQGMNFDENQKKGLMGLFRKSEQSIASLKAQYSKAEVNVDKIVDELQNHEVTLMKDIAMLDKMYEKNQEYQKELTMYILAGQIRAKQLREEELPKLTQKAQQSGLPEDAQAANDFANMVGRFEKKIHDLELTRMVSIQMAPQIRMIQNNDNLMAEKIQSSIVNTIPLWKSQMVMALSLYHSEQAADAQHEVSEVTNRLLEQNAQKLHQGSVEIAKESERGVVDIETLKKTNQELIATLDEVRQIQDDGRTRRAQAEEELGRIEGELKQKLLEIKG